MPDLQRRLRRVLRELPIGEGELIALLKLDPLAVVRGLRACNSMVFQGMGALPTVPGIAQSLGQTLGKRLFRQPRIEVATDPALQQLWRHAIATAYAAEELATRTGIMEPEAAYLFGLVHDLPEWLRRLHQSQPELAQSNFQPNDYIRNWQLPAPFVSLMLAIDMSDRPASAEDPADAAGLIRAAELLAELAGHHHPGNEEVEWLQQITKRVQPSELRLAQQLERRVNAAMRSFGFAPDITENEIAADDALFEPETAGGGLDEIIVSILSCTRSESYRGIVTALTAAAVRYGDYDRAFYAKWHDPSCTITLRSKADSSARRMVNTYLHTTSNEANLLRAALATQTPTHLTATSLISNGLLHTLATDELLAIPLNCQFETPAFLLLDRSVTLTTIRKEEDLTLATMLGMTGSLLVDNLLLRRRSQRAQKFALTDPLTRLFNRRMGMHALEQAVARTGRDGRPLTVLMCDLDHFKKLNDTLGHICGDAALRATADVLRYSVRKTDTVCRYGGEEFLVVLPDTTPDEAAVLATRMFTAVHNRGEELGLPISISIGLTSYRLSDTIESILIRADHALYASKGYGRNRFSADIEADGEPDEPPVRTQAHNQSSTAAAVSEPTSREAPALPTTAPKDRPSSPERP